MAADYAERGDFLLALETIEKAIELEADEAKKAPLRSRQELYLASKPYHTTISR